MPFQESFPLTNSEPGSFSPFWPPKSSVRKRSPSSTRSPSAGWKGSVQLTEAVPEKLGVYLLMLDLSNTTPVGRDEGSETLSISTFVYAPLNDAVKLRVGLTLAWKDRKRTRLNSSH